LDFEWYFQQSIVTRSFVFPLQPAYEVNRHVSEAGRRLALDFIVLANYLEAAANFLADSVDIAQEKAHHSDPNNVVHFSERVTQLLSFRFVQERRQRFNTRRNRVTFYAGPVEGIGENKNGFLFETFVCPFVLPKSSLDVGPAQSYPVAYQS